MNSTAVMHLYCKTSLTLTPAKNLEENEVSRVKCGDLITALPFLSLITLVIQGSLEHTGHLRSFMTKSADDALLFTRYC